MHKCKDLAVNKNTGMSFVK